MPELAEVEFYRKQWDSGIGSKVAAVALHPDKRIFRGTDTRAMQSALPGAKLISSEARGKQMVFRFSKGIWLGIHLGMTGKLRIEPPAFAPGKHDHLVLWQKERALVFSDPRQFGRVLFFQGPGVAPWWAKLPPELISKEFTLTPFADRCNATPGCRSRPPCCCNRASRESAIGWPTRFCGRRESIRA